MIYTLVFLSIIFIGIGFSINKKNAGYLLAGYNTMSAEEKTKIDIEAYLKTFKRFHLFLGLSFLLLGGLFIYFVGEDSAGLFLAIYPILAYTGWLIRGRFYFKSPIRKLAIGMLFFSLFIVVILFWAGQKQTEIKMYEQAITLTGIYGETIKKDDLKNIELVSELPPIKARVNGFAHSTIKKGVFKTQEGEKVKIFIHSESDGFIKILKIDGKQLYFNDKNGHTEAIFEELENWIKK